MITNQQLRAAFVDAPTMHYLKCKLAHLPEAELQTRIEETLKFLCIAHECTGAIPVSREIDEIWHYWILQTQEYSRLCELLPTGTFIHHSSNDYLRYFDPSVGERGSLEPDVKMLALYVANYGPLEESRTPYWLLAAHLVGRCGWSNQQLNDWLQAETFPEAALRRDCANRIAATSSTI